MFIADNCEEPSFAKLLKVEGGKLRSLFLQVVFCLSRSRMQLAHSLFFLLMEFSFSCDGIFSLNAYSPSQAYK